MNTNHLTRKNKSDNYMSMKAAQVPPPPSSLPELSRKLRVIGFCGVDDSVAPEMLQMITWHYPWVEWGVLFRSDLAGTSRYASDCWVESLSAIYSKNCKTMKLAAHLCGDRCTEVLNGNTTFVARIHQFGFNRMQINPTTANNVQINKTEYQTYAQGVYKCVTELNGVEWIFQLNDETRPIFDILLTKGMFKISLFYLIKNFFCIDDCFCRHPK